MILNPASSDLLVDDAEVPKPKSFRDRNKWIFLLLIEIGQFGLSYSFGGISTLQVQFEKFMGVTEIEYARLIQAQSIPGLILPIFAGVLTDYYGASFSFISGIVLTALGQLLVLAATIKLDYWLLFAGLIIKSSGVKVFYLGKAKMIRLWYRDSEMGKVTSISMIVSTSASIACDIGYPNIYQLTNTLYWPYTVAFALVFIAFIASLIQTRYHTVLMRGQQKLDIEVKERQTLGKAFQALKKFPTAFWLIIFSSVMETISFSATKMYESKFLQTSFNFTPGQAGFILAGGLVVTATVAPFAGCFVDKFGYLPQMLILSAFLNIGGIAGNALAPKCDRCFLPAVPLALMCAGSGVKEVVIMSAKMRLIKEKNFGFALSIFTTISSLMLLIYPGVTGQIAQSTFKESGYVYVFLANVGMAVCSLLLMIWLLFNDTKTGKRLQRIMESRTSTLVAMAEYNNRDFFEPTIKKLVDTKRAQTTVPTKRIDKSLRDSF